jgi:hypothetical protein
MSGDPTTAKGEDSRRCAAWILHVWYRVKDKKGGVGRGVKAEGWMKDEGGRMKDEFLGR